MGKSVEQVETPINPRTGNRRGMNPNSRKALNENRRLLKPGETANPKGLSITSRAKLMLPEVCPFDRQGRTWLEAEAEALLRHGLTKTDGMGELLDRTEGKVPQKITGDSNEPIVIKVVYEQSPASVDNVPTDVVQPEKPTP